MNPKNASEQTKENQHYLTRLVNSNPRTINTITRRGESFAAVYAISGRIGKKIIYVGETSDISRRMGDHLSGSSGLRKKSTLSENELKWCKVRYRRIANERQRKFFELFVISVLKPKFNL